jgi:hypothetical protein
MLTQSVSLASLGLLLGLICCRTDPETAGFLLRADAEKLYVDAFTTPLENVHLKASRGVAWQGHDAWILFTSDKAVTLRNGHLYRKADPSPYLEHFAAALKASDIEQKERLVPECLFYSDSSSVTPHGRYLLYDTDQGVYYFHSWKHF